MGDAKTFVNNMLRNEDWGNFALRCEEAQALRMRTEKVRVNQQRAAVEETSRSPFNRSEQEQRDSAVGLARLKVTRGEIAQAEEIAQRYGISKTEIGLGV